MAAGLVKDRSATFIGVDITLLAIATLVVALRLWTRRIILNQLGADDYLALISLLVVIGCGISMILGTRYGLGKHVSAINSETGSLYLRTFYVSIVLYTAALMLIKLTFLFQYYRLLAIQQMKTVYKVAILIVSGWALAQLFISIFACWPVQGFWDKTVEARCIPNQPQWYINAAGNILTDVIVLLLPLPAIRSLRLPRNQKLILAGIFSLGFLTVILSAIRIKYLQEFEDFTWEHVESHLWSMAELTSAPICASLPKLRPFVIHYFPDFASKLTRSFRGYVGGQRSRIHSGSDDFTPRQEIIPFKSSDQGTDQPLQNGAAFKMQPQDYSKAFGYSGNRLDEDLVGLWATVDVETSVVMPASVRDAPGRGTRIVTKILDHNK